MKSFRIIDNIELISGIHKFILDAPEIATEALPGQFLEIRCSNNYDVILRRPISISNSSPENGTIEFIAQARGAATTLLINKKKDDELDIIGPIGKGFSINNNKYTNPLIIGGGIGVFPLYFLAKNLNNRNLRVLLGFRNKACLIMEEDFKSVSDNVIISTDDGSYGYNGFVTDLLKHEVNKLKPDIIFSCGPLPMLKIIQDFALKNDIECELSVEERMGCGVGACLGCAVKVKEGSDWKFGHVCKDGPVFNAKKIILS